jgi:hypothetical protein
MVSSYSQAAARKEEVWTSFPISFGEHVAEVLANAVRLGMLEREYPFWLLARDEWIGH